MRTRKYNVSYEKLISRLPALFAYVEIDEQGNSKIIKATNGIQGNYGHIVADIECQVGFNYVCEDGREIILIKGKVYSYRTLMDGYYSAIEDIKSRLINKWGDKKIYEIVVKANFTDTIDGKEECFVVGQVIDDDTYYSLASENQRKCFNIFTNFEKEVNKEKEKYDFFKFIDKGIGLVYVGLSEEKTEEKKCGVTINKKYPLAPEYLYLGEAKTLYNQVIKMKKQISFWENHTKLCKEDRRYYLELKAKYEMMNGDKLLDRLWGMISEAETVATEYLAFSENNIPKIHLNVNLVNTIKDLGMVTPHIEEWVAGKRYYNGDVVYYTDEDGYNLSWECGGFYDDNGDLKDGVQIDEFGKPYIEGQYDKESELVLFENGKQILYDGAKIRNFWTPQSLNWVEENRFTKEKMPNTITVSGTANSHLLSLRKYEEYINANDIKETPDLGNDWLWYYRLGNIVNLETLYDENGNMAVLYGEDKWFNDRKEHAIYPNNVKAITNNGEEIGNNLIEENGNVVNLACWGDLITNISAINNEETGDGEITFEYWLGVHLMAEKDVDENGIWYSVDDDGNYKYFFKNLKADTNSLYGKNHGVKYTETYIYYESEDTDSIWSLVKNNQFDAYINGKLDKDSKVIEKKEDYRLYEKFEFNTSNNIYYYDIKIGNGFKNIPYIRSNFESEVDIRHIDVEKTPLIRYDYYNGVNYQPTTDKDVNIERGLTQAFEKHIKFSEIKTFEDLENYANGGFFSISQENIDLG